MTQTRHQSPVPANESPIHQDFVTLTKELTPDPVVESPVTDFPSNELTDLTTYIYDEPTVGPSKMPMSPSIEYLDDDDFDEEDDDEDKFNDEHIVPSSMPMKPPTTSISTIRLSQQNRVK